MSGRKSRNVESKHIRRINAKLANRIERHKDGLKVARHPQGHRKPGSRNMKKG